MKRPEIHLIIDDLIMDEATAANQSQLERALHRELGRRLTAHRAILPADAAAAASKQIANSISAKSSGGSERGGKGTPMNGFTGSPRLRKGALVCGPDVIQFQYNPESLSRSLRANAVGGSGPSDPLRYKGPPAETISLEVYIDAMDRLEQGDSSAGSVGIYPQLAALELLLYPNVMTMLANQALSLLGVVEILPATAPLILFVWGPKRVIPVRLNDFSITEEAFDAALNPIQAKVSISLQVLTYDDLGLLSRGGALSLGQHILKETLARSAVNSLRSLVPNLGLPSAGDALSAAQGAVNKAGKLTGLS